MKTENGKLKKYKLGEILDFFNGKQRPKNIGKYPLYGGNGIIDYVDEYNYDDNIIIGRVGANCGCVQICNEKCWVSDNAISVKVKSDFDKQYIFQLLKTLNLNTKHVGAAQPLITQNILSELVVRIPSLESQQKIAGVLSSLDDKIALNRRMNAKLEQMAKRLYDHWFVQFDFPNADGKPYKSSGGKMEYNEVLKREIPAGWEVKSISSFIKENIGGDWGKEEPIGNYQLKVSCCRGADIESMTDLPTRFILNSNSSKLLEENDMVVEISGGSPTQSTGRCVLISNEILSSFDNKLICSNFCQALSISDENYVSYFYHMWKMFYSNDIFFNFEGKTSGIKNFQYDTFVAEKWYFPPKELAKQFGEFVSKNYKMKCALDKENKRLCALRDRLLPLLMNGQVEVE